MQHDWSKLNALITVSTIELDQQQIKSLGNTSTAGHLGNIIGRKHCIPKYIDILINHFIMYT
jgi:hypothetical protein